jgi:putative FmdB family regulatory protein
VPRYDYECQTCHHVFEVKQSFSSEPVATCPECMNGAQRMIRAVPIVFKGTGFYVNDYGKGGGATASDPKVSEESKSESKSETKSESKSESKTESKSESSSNTVSDSKKESKAS